MIIGKPIRGIFLNKIHPLSRILLGLWILNEGSGDKIKDSLDISDGVLNGSTFWSNGSLSFDRTLATDYIDCGDSSLLNLVDGFTIIARINFVVAGTKVILSKDGGSSGWGFSITSGGDIRFTRFGVADITATSSNLTAGIWYTVGVTKSGSNYHFYANGNFIETVVQSGNVSTSSANINIGRRIGGGSGSDWFGGIIDYIQVFDGVLDANMHNRIYSLSFQMFQQQSFGFLTDDGGTTHLLEGSIIASSSLFGFLIQYLNLDGAINSISNLSGTLLLKKILSGSINAVSTLTGNIIRNIRFIGNISGISSFTGNTIRHLNLSGSLPGVSSFVSSLRIYIKLSGSIGALSSFVGNLIIVGEEIVKSILRKFKQDTEIRKFYLDTEIRKFSLDSEVRKFYVN